MTGYINHTYPSAKENFGNSMKKLRTEYKKPVFGFEVGQFEVLPDFSELDYFCGVTDPKNLQKIKERVSERGIKEEQWGRQVAASGELALICYREEIEAVLRNVRAIPSFPPRFSRAGNGTCRDDEFSSAAKTLSLC